MTSFGSEELSEPAESLSPRQKRIAARLHRQVGPGAATFFRDACVLLRERPSHPSVTHLVAHLLREVESAVRAVLTPADASGNVGRNRHQDQINAILAALGLPPDDFVGQLWLGHIGASGSPGLAALAHRRALDAPRPLGEEFRTLVDEVEQVLDTLLDRFETLYYEVFERLDMLLRTPRPRFADARALRQRFPRNQATSSYFFSRASALWVEPLQQAGFFSAPPSAELNEVSGSVQFSPWPESLYLARVAADAPQQVLAAALQIGETDNARVNHDRIEIALSLSAEAAASLVPQVIQSLSGRFGVLIPQRAGDLLVHLCRGGEVDEAMGLAEALLRHVPARSNAWGSVDAYAYSVILREHMPALVDANGLPVLRLLAETLKEVVSSDADRRLSRPGDDLSHVWRANLEVNERRAESDLRHALVDALLAAANTIFTSERGLEREVVEELESQGWLVFRRIALFTLAQHPEPACNLVTARLTDAALVADPRLEREYLLLAHRGSDCLDAAHRRRLLTLVDQGPRPNPLPLATSSAAVAELPESVQRERLASWQRDRLAAIQRVLPPEWDARYQALVAEFGDAPAPGTPAPEASSVWSFEGPVSSGELAAMPTDVLVAFLQTWEPDSDQRWLSPSSLHGALSNAVQEDAARRSTDAASFIGLPAHYIDTVINGLWQATTSGAILDWNGVVRLAVWVNEQAEVELADAADAPHRLWREPRLSMLGLLMAGLNPEPSPITAELEHQVWSIIERSCRDPDPTSAREAAYKPDQFGGWISLARTAVRPQAVRAAISYGLRLRRRSPDPDLALVATVLEQHLDRWQDPSSAVRSICGQLFPQLAGMDPDRSLRYRNMIFPADPAQRLLWDAATDAYLAGARLTTATWTLLSDSYSTMVDRLAPTSDEDVEDSRTARLGYHLLFRLWNGQLDPDSQQQLLRRFYGKAPVKIAAQLMWSIGVSLKEDAPPEPAVVERLTQFWEFRVAGIEDEAEAEELAAFGRWFASGHFDPIWSLRQLLTTLNRAKDVHGEEAVLARLADLAANHLQTCLTFLERWVTVTKHPWRISQSEDSIRRILTIGVGGNPTSAVTVQRIVSLLLRDHHIDLRDVLRHPPSA